MTDPLEGNSLKIAHLKKLEAEARRAELEILEIQKRVSRTVNVRDIIRWAVAGAVVAGLTTAWGISYLQPILKVETELAKKTSEIANLNNELLKSKQKQIEWEKNEIEKIRDFLEIEKEKLEIDRDELIEQNNNLNIQLKKQSKALEIRKEQLASMQKAIYSDDPVSDKKTSEIEAQIAFLNDKIDQINAEKRQTEERDKKLSYVEHMVIRGDSISKIQRKYCGNIECWPEIYYANAEKIGSNPNLSKNRNNLENPKFPNL